jgi:uncharacterized protein (TIGR02118 family)
VVIVSVLYPLAGGKRFDLDYYMNTHIPLVERLLIPAGLKQTKVFQSAVTPGTEPEFGIIAELFFDTAEELHAALAAHGPETQADIPNFTDATPIIWLGRVLM